MDHRHVSPTMSASARQPSLGAHNAPSALPEHQDTTFLSTYLERWLRGAACSPVRRRYYSWRCPWCLLGIMGCSAANTQSHSLPSEQEVWDDALHHPFAVWLEQPRYRFPRREDSFQVGDVTGPASDAQPRQRTFFSLSQQHICVSHTG